MTTLSVKQTLIPQPIYFSQSVGTPIPRMPRCPMCKSLTPVPQPISEVPSFGSLTFASSTSEEKSEIPIVIDSGSLTVKAGFAGHCGQYEPNAVFPAAVGRPRLNSWRMPGLALKDEFVGNEALSRKSSLSQKYPIENGMESSWDDIETIWRYAFDTELRVDPEEHSVLLTEGPLNPEKNRERTTHIMFETFCVPSMYLAIQEVLSLYASGRTTGIVLSVGYRESRAVPIYDGSALQHAVSRMDLGGKDLTEYLMTALAQRGHLFSEKEIARKIKKMHCYVADDFYEELGRARSMPSRVETNYELPDGRIFSIGSERFSCPEVLFSPNQVGYKSRHSKTAGIHCLAIRSITKCPADLQQELFANTVLSGGSTMFPNTAERLQKEMRANPIVSHRTGIKVVPSKQKYSVWLGGSLLASQPTFEERWISKEEYEEIGPHIVHRKCF